MGKTTHAHKASEEASSSSSDQYKGVRKRKWGKWVSEIRLPNSRERIWLGSYDTPQKAARAFDAALFCLRGPRAKFNFPHNPPNIAGAHSLTPPQIRAVAARFANEIQEEEEEEEEQPPAALPTEDGLHDRAVLTDHHDQSQLTLMEHYTSTTTTTTSSDGAVQVHVDSHDRTTIDWSFLNLSGSSVSVSDFDLGLDNLGGELFPPLTPTVPMDDDSGDENAGEAFSQQSFLWNF